MRRDATATKAKLIRAGERLFATVGVDAAQTREIVRLAEQANDSALHYHFGSRTGLLDAIYRKHIDRMEGDRAESLAELQAEGRLGDLHALVQAMLVPTAAELHTDDGRDFLRIVAQTSWRVGIRTRSTPGPLEGTVLQRQLELIQACCVELLPEQLALERLAATIGLLTYALSERARLVDEGGPISLGHEAFVANLVEMILGLIKAPVPAGIGRKSRGGRTRRSATPSPPGRRARKAG